MLTSLDSGVELVEVNLNRYIRHYWRGYSRQEIGIVAFVTGKFQLFIEWSNVICYLVVQLFLTKAILPVVREFY